MTHTTWLVSFSGELSPEARRMLWAIGSIEQAKVRPDVADRTHVWVGARSPGGALAAVASALEHRGAYAEFQAIAA
jgi:hypothetical protein